LSIEQEQGDESRNELSAESLAALLAGGMGHPELQQFAAEQQYVVDQLRGNSAFIDTKHSDLGHRRQPSDEDMELKLALEMSLAMAEAEALPIHISVLALVDFRICMHLSFSFPVTSLICRGDVGLLTLF